MNIKKSTLTKNNIFVVHAKYALKWQTLIGVKILTRSPNTTQKMTTSHLILFLPQHYNHFQIAQLMCVWAIIHIALMFIVVLIAHEMS